ncbi:MAG: CRISPR locus-related DNA-binding protein [Candidatus Aenigmarchaeota archaeon]|nr:CRISPR locus-related DNA-binding protein [Candidatus Aenigmarchaeota archaeon]
MANVLLTTVYSMDSIVLAITRLSIEKVFLLVDKQPDEQQKETVKKIRESFGKVLEISERKVEVYDIVSVAHSVVELIDSIPGGDEIYINITPARKTQALGLLFGAYRRSMRIKRIVYMIGETRRLIDLPVLSFDVSKTQLKILENIENYRSLMKLADDLGMSRAMLYRNIKTLKDMGLITETENGFRLTDAGKIARM